MPNLLPNVSDTTVVSDVISLYETAFVFSVSDTTVMSENRDIVQNLDYVYVDIMKNYRYVSAILKLAYRASRQAIMFNNPTVGSKSWKIRNLLADADGTQPTNIKIAQGIVSVVESEVNEDIANS